MCDNNSDMRGPPPRALTSAAPLYDATLQISIPVIFYTVKQGSTQCHALVPSNFLYNLQKRRKCGKREG